jgi:hypothetical protein
MAPSKRPAISSMGLASAAVVIVLLLARPLPGSGELDAALKRRSRDRAEGPHLKYPEATLQPARGLGSKQGLSEEQVYEAVKHRPANTAKDLPQTAASEGLQVSKSSVRWRRCRQTDHECHSRGAQSLRYVMQTTH